MSSYASYEKVGKGARKLASAADEHDKEQGHYHTSRRDAAETHSSVKLAGAAKQHTIAIKNMQEFLEETAHDRSKEDPDFNLNGLAYVFHLLFMGTVPWANRVVSGSSLPEQSLAFVINCLRGVGQVFFMNNPLTGLIILIGLFVQSPRVAVYGIIGRISSNAFALALALDSGLVASGLFGYNGILCGLALATFYGDSWSAPLVFVTIFISMVSTVLFITLGRLLVPYKVPPFTLPFNIALFIYLLASANMPRLATDPIRLPAFPEYKTTAAQDMPAVSELVFLEAILKGVGQVFLADKTTSGIIITVGLFICSPITAFAALMGSLVGTSTALLTGAPVGAVASGLYGYNASLTFAALFGMWFCPSVITFAMSVFAAMLSNLLTDFVSGIFSPFGLPAATLPFCLCILLFDLIQVS
jgi:urea transporter